MYSMKGVKSFQNIAADPTLSEAATSSLINSDFKDIGDETLKLVNHVIELGVGGEIVTGILQWLVLFTAIYLMVTNRRATMLTELLVLYVFLTFPNWFFGIMRGEFGRWILFIGVLLRLFFGAVLQMFFPYHFPDSLLLPGSTIMLIVVAPDFVASDVKLGWIGVIICFGIVCYLLQEHIRASEGFKNTFINRYGIHNTIGIALLFVFPIWALIGLI